MEHYLDHIVHNAVVVTLQIVILFFMCFLSFLLLGHRLCTVQGLDRSIGNGNTLRQLIIS